jgi:beta-lactamase superfamily II metal-dependent hydrolase
VVSIEVLPAAHGDSLWIEYGSATARRILIDGGPAHSYEAGLRRRIAKLNEKERNLELMVVTHIDADHIDGALIMLQELTALQVRIKEFWFNGWQQLPKLDRDIYAPLQGEFLGGLIQVNPELRAVWNHQFNNQAVVVPDRGPLPEVVLDDETKITLLGPALSDLRRLRARWASAIRDFSPGDVNEALRRLSERREYRRPPTPAVFAAPQYGDDRTVANGSSISFLFEHAGVSILFGGDAHARTLAASLARLAAQRSTTRLQLNAVKLPHHGSMGNVSEAWLQWVDCNDWVISTNGAIFDHPDVATARLIADNCSKIPTMFCNYRTPSTERLSKTNRWTTRFAEGDFLGPAGGLRLIWTKGAAAGAKKAGTTGKPPEAATTRRAKSPRAGTR